MTKTDLPEVLILEPKVFGDDRVFFFESFNQKDFQQVTSRLDHKSLAAPKCALGAGIRSLEADVWLDLADAKRQKGRRILPYFFDGPMPIR